MTNGVTATLFITSDEEIGIRVMWSIKSEYLGCQFTTLRVELNNVGKDVSANETFKNFYKASDHLDCNSWYTPKVHVRITTSRMSKTEIESGATLFYGSN